MLLSTERSLASLSLPLNSIAFFRRISDASCPTELACLPASVCWTTHRHGDICKRSIPFSLQYQIRNRQIIPKGINCEKLLRDLARELDLAKVRVRPDSFTGIFGWSFSGTVWIIAFDESTIDQHRGQSDQSDSSLGWQTRTCSFQ